jgi:hypothetical protein
LDEEKLKCAGLAQENGFGWFSELHTLGVAGEWRQQMLFTSGAPL